MANLMGLGDIFDAYQIGSLGRSGGSGGPPALGGLADLIGGGEWRPPLLPPGIAGPVTPPDAVQAPESPPTSRGRLADLLEQLTSAPPEGPRDFGDLSPDRRRGANMEALGMLAQAIGGAQPGRLGAALGSAAAAMPMQREAVVEEERRRMAEAEARRRDQIEQQISVVEAQRQLEAEQASEAQQAQVAERAGRLAEVITSLVPEGDPLREQVAIAASQGDIKGLNELLMTVRRNAALRAQGLDPDDPYAGDRAKAQLGIETEEEKRRRGLGTYHQAPQRPEQYAPQIEEFADGVYLVDRNKGTRTYLGPADENDGVEVKLREGAYADTVKEMERYGAPMIDEDGAPMRRDFSLPEFPFEERMEENLRRRREAIAPRKAPRPRRQSMTAPGTPTSDAGAPGEQPKGTVDAVLAKLPPGVRVTNPQALQMIEEDLASGKKPQDIIDDIIAALGGR